MCSLSSRGEHIFLAIVAFTFLSSAGLLARDAFLGGGAGTGEKVGLITYRNHEAEQKCQGSVLWTSAAQKGPVYNRDTIRTGPDSSAVIALENGVEIDLAADSMVVVSVDRAGAKLELARGGAVLDSRRGQGSLTLASGGREVRVTGGKLSLTKAGKETSLNLLEGSAEKAVDGKAERLEAGKSYGLSSGAATARGTTLLEPETGAIILSKKKTAAISLSWMEHKAAGDGHKAARSVEIAAERSFATIAARIPTRGSSATAVLAAGSWYWRLEGESDCSWFTIRELVAPRPLEPNGASFSFLDRPVTVPFSWLGAEGELYRLTIAKASAPDTPIYSGTLSRQSLAVPIDAPGDYLWKVASLNGKEAIPAESAAIRFSVVTGALAVPRIQGDTGRGLSVPAEELAGGGPLVSWRDVPNADRYEVAIAPVGGQSLSPISVSGNYLATKLASGRYTASVRALAFSGASSAFSEPVAITVLARSSPVAAVPPPAGSTTPPAAAPAQSAPPAGELLEPPRPLAPVAGARLDINRIDSIKLSWEGSAGASRYTVRLFRTTGGLRSPIGEWTTDKSELVITDFSMLSLDPFAWELVAQKGATKGRAAEASTPVTSYFRIVQGEELGAVKIRKMTVKGGYQ